MAYTTFPERTAKVYHMLWKQTSSLRPEDRALTDFIGQFSREGAEAVIAAILDTDAVVNR